jgi:signal transduction histidine kinase
MEILAQSLLDRFSISAEDLSLLQECGRVLGSTTIERVVDRFHEWLFKQPESTALFNSKAEVDRVRNLQKAYWGDFFSGVVDQRYVEYRVRLGDLHVQRDLPTEGYFAGMLQFQLLFMSELRASLSPDKFPQATSAFTKLVGLDTYVVSDQILQVAKRRITESGKAMLAMSTETLRLHEEMRQSSRLMMMGELTASLAHELNQPLVAVLNNAQAGRRFLTTKNPPLNEVKDILDEIINDNIRAAEIIRNLRSLFQRDEMIMSRVDLHQVLHDVERIVRPDALRRNIAVRVEAPVTLPPVAGNRTELVQATINLVQNAFDSICEVSEGPREVEVDADQRDAGWVHVTVRDSGKGINPKFMPRLFDAFFTTKPTGMGMGLAIVHSIIERHGGRIWAAQNPDRGATLEFVLPLEPRTRIAAVGPKSRKKKSHGQGTSKRPI